MSGWPPDPISTVSVFDDEQTGRDSLCFPRPKGPYGGGSAAGGIPQERTLSGGTIGPGHRGVGHNHQRRGLCSPRAFPSQKGGQAVSGVTRRSRWNRGGKGVCRRGETGRWNLVPSAALRLLPQEPGPLAEVEITEGKYHK